MLFRSQELATDLLCLAQPPGLVMLHGKFKRILHRSIPSPAIRTAGLKRSLPINDTEWISRALDGARDSATDRWPAAPGRIARALPGSAPGTGGVLAARDLDRAASDSTRGSVSTRLGAIGFVKPLRAIYCTPFQHGHPRHEAPLTARSL